MLWNKVNLKLNFLQNPDKSEDCSKRVSIDSSWDEARSKFLRKVHF
jgi:hypothetical protein